MKSVADFLTGLDIDFKKEGEHHHARRGWVQIDCPFCMGMGKYHLGIRLDLRRANCWRCGGHDVAFTLARASRKSYGEISLGLKATYAGSFESIAKSPRPKSLKLPRGLAPLSSRAADYLESRGFDLRELDRLWDVDRSFRIHPKYSHRVFIPMFDEFCNPVSYTTRSILDDVTLRYRSCDESDEVIPIKHLLYGEHLCVGRSTIVVVEGPVDAWKIGPGAVALCGTAFTQQQVERISKYRTKYVCFDSEPTAQQVAKRLCADLSVLAGEVFNLSLETAADPGELQGKELEDVRALL